MYARKVKTVMTDYDHNTRSEQLTTDHCSNDSPLCTFKVPLSPEFNDPEAAELQKQQHVTFA